MGGPGREECPCWKRPGLSRPGPPANPDIHWRSRSLRPGVDIPKGFYTAPGKPLKSKGEIRPISGVSKDFFWNRLLEHRPTRQCQPPTSCSQRDKTVMPRSPLLGLWPSNQPYVNQGTPDHIWRHFVFGQDHSYHASLTRGFSSFFVFKIARRLHSKPRLARFRWFSQRTLLNQ